MNIKLTNFKRLIIIFVLILLMVNSYAQLNQTHPIVTTLNGTLEGINESGINIFEGVPFAAPPVGDLRWKEPQPVQSWQGVRKATHFAPRPMQNAVFGDMNFRSDSVSEDCLYLNIWTPAKKGDEKLPVLVYFYGGGFIAGSSDEYRYDGENMARRGIVSVTVNYRLGIFGFFALPALTKESPNHSSGNYGYLDQTAALRWIKDNISSFGGDPDKITIAGESAGSISVSAQMASPLAQGLFHQAIASSGSLMGALPSVTLDSAENKGVNFTKKIGIKSLKNLRMMSSKELLKYNELFDCGTIDGYFMPQSPEDIYTNEKENKVPLLIGWNSQEMTYQYLIGNKPLTYENIKKYCDKQFGKDVDKVLFAYGITSDNATLDHAANALACDMFIAFSTWKWSNLVSKTGLPVYRYLYCHPRPYMAVRGKVAALAGGTIDDPNAKPYKAKGAVHSADIEYAMGNLPTNRVYDWMPDDYLVSDIFQMYYVNFVKYGNPNGLGLIDWSEVKEETIPAVMQLNADCVVKRDEVLQKRYELMDSIIYKK